MGSLAARPPPPTLALAATLICLLAAAAANPPPGLCKQNTIQRLSECLRKAYTIPGASSRGEAPRSPLRVGRLSAGRGGATVAVHLSITAVFAAPAAAPAATSNDLNATESVDVEVKAYMHRGTIEGPYEVLGDQLLLPLCSAPGGGGPCANTTRLHVCRDAERPVAGCVLLCAAGWQFSLRLSGSFAAAPAPAVGKRRFSPRRTAATADAGLLGVAFHVPDADPALAKQMNAYLTENADYVLWEVQPAVEEALTGVAKQLVSRLFSRTDYEDIAQGAVE